MLFIIVYLLIATLFMINALERKRGRYKDQIILFGVSSL